MSVEWDPVKAQHNERKHGVTFLEAQTVLNDPLGIVAPDIDHSELESRWRIIGLSSLGRLLVVIIMEEELAHTRIISARQPTRRERADYEQR